ncbi:MAG: hypothetical protein HQ478_05075 [Chloroflexi bacterium]|nr:hypothetical protein [Chloroflexota bacterium]
MDMGEAFGRASAMVRAIIVLSIPGIIVIYFGGQIIDSGQSDFLGGGGNKLQVVIGWLVLILGLALLEIATIAVFLKDGMEAIFDAFENRKIKESIVKEVRLAVAAELKAAMGSEGK